MNEYIAYVAQDVSPAYNRDRIHGLEEDSTNTLSICKSINRSLLRQCGGDNGCESIKLAKGGQQFNKIGVQVLPVNSSDIASHIELPGSDSFLYSWVPLARYTPRTAFSLVKIVQY